MVDAGALGYVIKGSPIARLLEAVRTVSLNRHYFDPELGIRNADDLAPYLNYTAPE